MKKEKEWDPSSLLEVSGSYWQSCALHAGVKLGLFSIIENHEATAEGVAARLGADKRGTATLLNALSAMGLMTKTGGRYANTPFSKAYLVQGSPQYMGFMVMHHHHLVEGWSRLDQAILSGRPTRQRSHAKDEERESFLMGMFNMAMGIAPRLAGIVDLKGRDHLLDLGGGPGTYAIHFCLTNPGLRATVADLPTSREFAQKTIARFGVSDRIAFAPCNYLEDDIPGHYDVAWLSHILHGEGPQECRMIVARAASVLAPKGMIMIHDFILWDTLDGPLFPALFSLNMLVNTPSGRAYAEGEIRELMKQAGFVRIERLPFEGPNASGILTGTKP